MLLSVLAAQLSFIPKKDVARYESYNTNRSKESNIWRAIFMYISVTSEDYSLCLCYAIVQQALQYGQYVADKGDT